MYPLITRDPISGGELIITRVECPTSGIVIEGQFSLGWIGQLTPEQLEFVEQLVRQRGNIQKVAADMGVSYSTARNRMDDIVAALDGIAMPAQPDSRESILDQLAAGELSFEEAMRQIREQS